VSRKPRRDAATTGFALILWFAAAMFAAVATTGWRLGQHWPLLLWYVVAFILTKVGVDLWKMGRR